MSSDDIVLYEVENHIATITLNRPKSRNALLVETFEILNKIWKELDEDDDVRVAILTGSDCGTFCAGMDLKQAAAVRRDEGVDILKKIGDPAFSSMREIKTPMIAAINGFAPAGGMMLSLNCDLRVAVAGAQLGITEVHRGRGSPWAMPLFWQMPQALVTELTLVGDFMPAERFHEVGFINYIEPDVPAMMARARTLAERISSAAPLSVQAAKRSGMAAMDMVTGHALKVASMIHEKAYESEDAIEGPLAFSEKRDPVWKGR
ncbi:MAG: enoyl-CoA hydratase/isomerase family protein [Pseudomonadales bacterium]|nr:enoyl-CoA hydratase/isomerase family protein [Pseudomonadales bacterium]